MPSDTTEIFTWKCLTQASCHDCPVAEFVDSTGISVDQCRKLMEIATAAGSYLRQEGSSREVVITRLATEYPDTSAFEATIAVDGFLQSQKCSSSNTQSLI